MFRPIKNLITYIQKNASSSAIFGNATSAIVSAETEAEPKNVAEAIEAEKTSIAAAEQCHEINKMNQMEVQELKNTTLAKSAVTTPIIMNNSFDEDDIELQIKSSIMLKKPLVAPDSVVLVAKTGSEQQIVLLSPSHKHNDDSQALDDELDDFRFEPTHNGVAEDFCSISSAELAGGDDTAEECNTEEEEAEEQFLDFTPELNGFQGSEIIVLNDADLNSSIASDVLSEDPLAIDDLTQPSIMENAQQLDSSSTADEASTSADMLWLDENELKTRAPTPLLKPSNVLPEAPQKRAPLSAITREQQHQIASSEEQAEELRSDGSDSGLGSETSNLHNTLNGVTDTSTTHTYEQSKGAAAVDVNADAEASCNTSATPATPAVLSAPKPLRSNLKRSLEVDDDDMLDAPSLAVDCASASAMCLASSSSQQKKPKRSINFDTVQVYYFPRQQGFGCVPSAGGCTLGMASQHVDSKTLTLAEHAAELRRAHRLQLQEINPRGSSSDDSEESEEDYLSEGSGSDLDAESNGFLQPVSPKQRRALLKAAGVRKIDASEKVECRDIRNSREVCGCTCRDFCDPETCACNQAGIKCQVDRAMFPCGCSRDACGNTVGRVEFNPARVRTHYIHTVMRLEMENRQQQQPPPLCAGSSLGYGMTVCSSSVSASISASAGTQTGGSAAHALTQSYYGLTQSQSNYSSGYASPAYNSDPAANYYQPHPAAQNAPYNGLQPDMPSLHQQATPQYQLDSLDAGLFSGAAAATPSYGELMPSYGAVSTATASSAAVYHNMSYAAVNGSMQAQVSTSAYSSYYLAPTHSNSSSSAIVPSTYSSCAVPSAPPYGSATTVASGQYHSECSVALDTAAPSCGSLDGAAGSSFIDLNTPIASSSRLSQINDLLQHNRNTTAALVAVSQSASCNIDLNSVHAPPVRSLSASTSSIDTPPIEDTHKISLSYEQLPSPLHPTPIVAVLERESVEKSPTPTATTVAATTATTNAFNTLAND